MEPSSQTKKGKSQIWETAAHTRTHLRRYRKRDELKSCSLRGALWQVRFRRQYPNRCAPWLSEPPMRSSSEGCPPQPLPPIPGELTLRTVPSADYSFLLLSSFLFVFLLCCFLFSSSFHPFLVRCAFVVRTRSQEGGRASRADRGAHRAPAAGPAETSRGM